MKVTDRQYGLWDSPISAAGMSRGINFSDIICGSRGRVAWHEMRGDQGMVVIQSSELEAPRDLNSDFSMRAKVGYGGGDFTLGDQSVYFVDADSGRLYRQDLPHGSPKALTPSFGRCASPALSPDGLWLAYVHSFEDQDSLAIIDAQGKFWPSKLVSGDDFYMQPAWHPGGTQIAWIAWDQPNMPWDGTSLRMANLIFRDDSPPVTGEIHTLVGDEHNSIFQPQFSPDGRFLAYASDATGWWQLYLYQLEAAVHRQVTTHPADHAGPAWVQGVKYFAFSPDSQYLLFIRNQEGFASLWQVPVEGGQEMRIPLEDNYTWLEQISVAPEYDHQGKLKVGLLASGNQVPDRVIAVTKPASDDIGLRVHVLQRGTAEDLSPGSYSLAKPITWPGMDGEEVYGLFFSPYNPQFKSTGKPPLIVNIHGGPTSQVRAFFNPRDQYFATRGYAVLEVNYRGSTGYGRAYWQALNGSWGKYDVEDAISGVHYLVDQGMVDGSKVVIMGGSAGGFTVLQSLVDHPGFFKAGICLYGVANQFTLAADTHKFEARYLDQLLGPLPEAADLYRERSPILHADRIQDPLIVFQGEDDVVVPRAQSDQIVASLERRGVPHEYHLYPGEGHGFRKAETIEHFYNTVESFLKQYAIFS